MSIRTARPPAQRVATPPPPPALPEAARTATIGRASLIGGIGLLLMTVFAAFGNFVAVEGLVTDGDAARTATDITASEGTFRLGVMSLLLVIALDVVVAWALYRVFRPVSRNVSMVSAGIRLAYAAVFLAAIGELVGVVRLLGDDSDTASRTTEQLGSQILVRVDSFTDIWQAALFLFGLHLALVGYLAYRSGYVPRILGALLAVAGVGYAFDSVVHAVAPGSLPTASSVLFVGEFLLAVWLVVRGRRLMVTDTASSTSNSIGVPR